MPRHGEQGRLAQVDGSHSHPPSHLASLRFYNASEATIPGHSSHPDSRNTAPSCFAALNPAQNAASKGPYEASRNQRYYRPQTHYLLSQQRALGFGTTYLGLRAIKMETTCTCARTRSRPHTDITSFGGGIADYDCDLLATYNAPIHRAGDIT